MKKAFLLNILSFIGLALFAQPNYDSLYLAAANLNGQERLDAYYYFYLQHFREHDSAEKLLDFLNRYKDEATSLQNISDEAYARSAYCNALFNYHLFDRFTESLPENFTFFEENNLMSYYSKLFTLSIDYYVMTGKYQTAIRECEQLHNEYKNTDNYWGLSAATYSLGFTYAAMKRYDKAESYFRETIAVLDKIPIAKSGENLNLTCDRLAECLLVEKKYLETIKACDMSKQRTFQYLHEVGLENDTMYSFAYTNMYYAYAYIGMNQLDKASHYIELVRNASQNDNYIIMGLYGLESDYYAALGDYEKAIEMMNKVIEYQSSIDSRNVILAERKGDLAELMYKTKRYQEAYDLFKEYYYMMDSIQTFETRASLDEFSSIFELDKMTSQQEKWRIKAYFHTTFSVMLVIILLVIVYFYRLTAKKNKALYKKIHERVMDSRNKVPASFTDSGDGNTDIQLLINKIEQAIISNGLFNGVNVSRKAVSDQLDVSEKFINDVIRDNCDMNYNDFLNEIRLQHACKLIIENPAYTLESIAYESGFNNRTTFSRVFTDTYGISPSEFRRINNEKKSF